MTHIMDMRPIARGAYRQQCKCYAGLKPKPLDLEIDEENDIVYCVHCGNIMSPMNALNLMVELWDKLEADIERARAYAVHNYKIAHKYRPHKRAMRMIEQGVGKKNEMLPVCPNCGEGFELEQVKSFIDRRLYAHLKSKRESEQGV